MGVGVGAGVGVQEGVGVGVGVGVIVGVGEGVGVGVEGVKCGLITCENKSDCCSRTPAIYIRSIYRGTCTEIF